jgi:shikimate kinase
MATLSDSQSIADIGAPVSCAGTGRAVSANISAGARERQWLVRIQRHRLALFGGFGCEIADIGEAHKADNPEHQDHYKEFHKPPDHRLAFRVSQVSSSAWFIYAMLSKVTPSRGGIKNRRGAAVLALKVKKPIVMVGMMGAGKSAVGRTLAQTLGVAFLDSDHEIERAAAMSIAEVFERDGEAFFRARETEVIRRLLETGPCVISTGGGAFLAEENRRMIHDAGVSVWLRADLDLLWERVRHKPTRPLLQTPDPKGTLKQLYEARVHTYAKADLVVDGHSAYTLGDMTKQVIRVLKTRSDVLEDTGR